MRSLRILSILLIATIYGCTSGSGVLDNYDDPDNPSGGGSGSGGGSQNEDFTAVNQWSDAQMKFNYLYNEEYATMTRDFNLLYDDFITSTLTRMSTNTLDNKYLASYGVHELFSKISRVSTPRSSYDNSKYAVSYGSLFTECSDIIYYGQGIKGVTFYSIYPDSPLDKCDVTRANLIYKVNGEIVTSANEARIKALIDSPALGDKVVLTDAYTQKEYTITADYVYLNPIIECRTVVVDGGVKVGYLNFSRFDKNFDSELKTALAELNSEDIDELVLDLRLNLGGDASTANMLTTCIASITAPKTPLLYYRYNKDVTKYYASAGSALKGLTYDESTGYFLEYAAIDSAPAASHLSSLRDKRIYCLTTINSASASELVINLLRGLGYEVTTIGMPSRGKNVGSWLNMATIGDYTYYLQPITTQAYNTQLESDYSNGFTPEDSNLLKEPFPYKDYGVGEEYFDRAVELITGSIKSSANDYIESRTGSTITPVNHQTATLTPAAKLPSGMIVEQPRVE